MTGRSRRERGGEKRGDPKVGLQPLRPLQTERRGERFEGRGHSGVIVSLGCLERVAELHTDLMFLYVQRFSRYFGLFLIDTRGCQLL